MTSLSKNGNRRERRSGKVVSNASTRGQATTIVRGNAQSDGKTAVPVFGTEYENKRMLYYETGFELKSSSGLLQTWFFRANDAYDPDATGTGTQPAGFDQAMASFNHFVVMSSKIRVRFVSNSASVMIVGIFLNPDTTPPATIIDAITQGQVVHGLIYGASTASFGGAAHTVRKADLSCYNPKYFSQTASRYQANPNFNGDVATSPSEMVYYGVFAYCMNGAFDYSTVWDVQLSYDVKFWEPSRPSSSLMDTIARFRITEQTIEKVTGAEQKRRARMIRAMLEADNPNYHIRHFCIAMEAAGFWQPKTDYDERRHREALEEKRKDARYAKAFELGDRFAIDNASNAASLWHFPGDTISGKPSSNPMPFPSPGVLPAFQDTFSENAPDPVEPPVRAATMADVLPAPPQRVYFVDADGKRRLLYDEDDERRVLEFKLDLDKPAHERKFH